MEQMKRTAIIIPTPSLTHSALAGNSNAVTTSNASTNLLSVTKYPTAQTKVTKSDASSVLHTNFHVSRLRITLLLDASPEIMSAITFLIAKTVLMRSYPNVKGREGNKRIQCLQQLCLFQEMTQKE